MADLKTIRPEESDIVEAIKIVDHVEFPINQEDLVYYAEQEGVHGKALEILESLPPEELKEKEAVEEVISYITPKN
jgi:hypothetical protein